MNEQLRMIAQNYCGMTPNDKGCKTWDEMQQKMADELKNVVKNNIVLIEVNGQSELLISLIKELINVGIIDENDINVELWVKSYLKEINNECENKDGECHRCERCEQ